MADYINQVELIAGNTFTSLDVSAAMLKLALEKELASFDSRVDFTEQEIVSVERKKPRHRNRRRGRSSGGYGKKERKAGSAENKSEPKSKKKSFGSDIEKKKVYGSIKDKKKAAFGSKKRANNAKRRQFKRKSKA